MTVLTCVAVRDRQSAKLDFQDMQAAGGWLIQLSSIFPTKMQQFLSHYLPELARFPPQTRLFHHWCLPVGEKPLPGLSWIHHNS